MTTGALLRRAASRSTRILAGEPYGVPHDRRGRTKRHEGRPLSRKRQHTPPGFSWSDARGSYARSRLATTASPTARVDGRTAKIRRDDTGRRGRLDGTHHARCLLRQAQVLEHQAAVQMAAMGLAMPWPAMSGALPWTGSNMLGWRRSGSRLALAAMPKLPPIALPDRRGCRRRGWSRRQPPKSPAAARTWPPWRRPATARFRRPGTHAGHGRMPHPRAPSQTAGRCSW